LLAFLTDSEAVELLTKAAKENSDNEELGQEAFIQMIKLNEIQKAQQVCPILPPTSAYSEY